MMDRAQFSRTQTLDLRLSLAAALAEHLRGMTFNAGGRALQFARVYDEWPAWQNDFVSPAAVVLPDEELTYADARLTPTLLEETWEPQDSTGKPIGLAGWGLYQLADGEVDLSVNVRAPTPGERTAIVRGIEEAFVSPNATGDYREGARYGILLPLPTYYGLAGRFSLQMLRELDDADTVARKQREVIFVVRAQAPQVKVGVVQPFKLRITEIVR